MLTPTGEGGGGGRGQEGVNTKGVCARVEGWPTGGDGGDGGDGGGGGVLVKKPVITRLDSGLDDRKIRSSPLVKITSRRER